MERHKTHKNAIVEPLGEEKSTDDSLKKLLDGGVRIALQRPWHRIERGLRLGRLRQFIDDVASQYHMTDKDKESFFTFLQKSLDNKLLNTIKVVDYDQETERIRTIKGLEIKRNQEGNLRWAFSSKTVKKEAGTRKKKKPEPSVSTIIDPTETKIEEKMEQ
jgi:hypothetical protein